MWNIPNLLTSFRIVLIPVFLIIYYIPGPESHFWAAFVFAIAGITDALDGWVARKFNQFTKFGAFLDPVADKVMVAASLIVVVENYAVWWISIPALAIVSRELVVSALREWMAQIGRQEQVKVSNLGKLKTIAQMVAIGGLIWEANSFIIGTATLLLYIAFVLTLWSMWEYLRAAWSDLSQVD
ncbi:MULTISPECIES: CDP-diacylglycerol--glycerol-3-phosphate 3-phosphatidyltransferase [Idiomarinaceae]|uniref:CDP-diacylglycerol--glycerol-3-phosphate 3-phosphatidyltransferase n=3 Tax=Pseudidiomarina TaxID=2800384 RepID=A0A368V1Z1_9GAMM|nr:MULTISPECIES: CDP-diacylglycerol--glycerol-3-phosphate 3-phosphatidyltransferase [Idiomarinaceae]MDX1525056.1 CDP-diacylglycerol--glycerol-3-phosphate 3-phosphatidyltransferase [Pseudidiomarina maritima]MRJ40782.1 CDP-diacylglycerol--glycerol-3-phosphate 3-phosphatidyltransferase [Idiomarina sp. FeN1]NCU56586.1 CDP-diacylglycerol--glycerol-3-phosphate 3-phosphatidyltransferase [Idiomarina sp. FenA--70]NCU58966.1 CDP-diacylglycerol--glycerol-3-phosphate 3-phosphatidyltransferase [Idiomarina s